jgi:hypothetical protein
MSDEKLARRQGTSPIVAVLLQENAVEAAESAIDALSDARAYGKPKWLTRPWVNDRVRDRIGADSQLARSSWVPRRAIRCRGGRCTPTFTR